MALFSESSARVLVSVPAALADAFTTRCAEAGLPCHRLGTVEKTDTLEIAGIPALPLTELREAWEATLPALFD